MPKRPHNNDAESENRFFSVLRDETPHDSFINNVSAGFGVIKGKVSEVFGNISEGASIVAHDLKVGANSASKNISTGAEFVRDNISCGKVVIEKQLEEKSAAAIEKAQEEYEEKFTRKQRIIALAAELEITKTTLKAALILMLITAVAFAYITSAWFVRNREVTGQSMVFKTKASPNLVIASSVSELQNYTSGSASSVVLFTDDALGMKPARHFFDSDNTNHTYPVNYARTEYVTSTDTGLVYNTNPTKVTMDKGYEMSGETLTFSAVPEYEAGNSRYYVDYTVYIASIIQEMSISELEVSINCSNKSKDYINAGSVDFYVGSVSSSNYKGTLNVSGKNCDNSGDPFTLVDLTGSCTVPLNTSGDYITVIMRFYFDGGLEKETGQAYVYTDGLTTADFDMTVSFEAIEETA